jgi:hypothetical protein
MQRRELPLTIARCRFSETETRPARDLTGESGGEVKVREVRTNEHKG